MNKMAKYKQKCIRCKKNYVIISWKQKYPICYECQKEELHKKIKNKKMQKFFDIPEEFYKQSSFLRSVKLYYLRFNTLSEKQIEVFKETVKKLKKKN